MGCLRSAKDVVRRTRTGSRLGPEEEQKEHTIITATKTSLLAKLLEVGSRGDPPIEDEGDMIEKTGTSLEEEEINLIFIVLLTDSLEKMLRYRPEDRITIKEVMGHPLVVTLCVRLSFYLAATSCPCLTVQSKLVRSEISI